MSSHSQTGGSSCYNNSGEWNSAVYGGMNQQHAVSAGDHTIAMTNPYAGGKRRRRYRRKTACGGYKLSSRRRRQTKRSSRRG